MFLVNIVASVGCQPVADEASVPMTIDDLLDEMHEQYGAGDLHVYPIDDLLPHNEDGCDCPCDPKIEVHGACLLVIHNAYDGRE